MFYCRTLPTCRSTSAESAMHLAATECMIHVAKDFKLKYTCAPVQRVSSLLQDNQP
jgi:hypothetical protein